MTTSSDPAGTPVARPSAVGAWWQAARPKTLLVSFSPVLVGTALAYAETGQWMPWVAFVALLAALLIQIGTNLHNDVADFERGADTPDRLGPPRATAMGWLTPHSVRRAAWACFAGAFLLGILLVWRGGWPIVAVGLASLTAGWAYTGGPRPIAYSPFGEVFVLLFFGGCAVGGSYFLQALDISPAALVAASALGAFAAAVISVNNTRDLGTDARVGKRTLAVRIGRRPMTAVYALELLVPFAVLPLLGGEGRGVLLALPALAAVPALLLVRRFAVADTGQGFNGLLADTARLQAGYAVLLAVALVAAV